MAALRRKLMMTTLVFGALTMQLWLQWTYKPTAQVFLAEAH